MSGIVQALNTMAVDQIHSGEYAHAKETLQLALREFTDGKERHLGQSENRTPSFRINEIQFEVYYATNGSVCEDFEEGYFPYPCMFEFPIQSSAQDQDTDFQEQPLQDCCAWAISGITCLFNLGLCDHLSWLAQRKTKDPTSDVLLQEALFHYHLAFCWFSEYSYCILKEFGKDAAQVLEPDPVLPVVIALYLNACHCCCKLSNLEQLQVWNHLLYQTLIWGCSQADPGLENFRAFFLNCVFNNQFSGSAASAA